MGAKRKHGEALIQEFLNAKTLNPDLTLTAFCRDHQPPLDRNSVWKAISYEADARWERISAQAKLAIEKKQGRALAEIVNRALSNHQELLGTALPFVVKTKTVKDGKQIDLEAVFEPKTYEGALRGVEVGTRGLLGAVEILAGKEGLQGEPLPEAGATLEWNSPTGPAARAAVEHFLPKGMKAKRRKKPKPKK